ncbi:RagB/SusD family nutrient uptake outer membrane protein [Spirosoma aureum]|uniref:RagB/SusD family nutrient uptake outer membrane protein n=1 Tax=Spirosoma aureum TaxID=2692134 RepID=A0A6G9AND1_9BACT|nr:RagB/SusD family nutrient uptake outer membrane protein [Spirosoma aureum]QIP13846.1 RagB/SusD family nutrient uptake outer membrane protein [Spirosoma aureum]
MRTHLIIRYIALLSVWVALGACKTFLDQPPQSAVSTEEAIADPAGARAAMMGLYASLASGYGQTYTVYPDLLADNLAHNGSLSDLNEFKNHAILAANGSIGSLWQSFYQGINQANNLLDQVPLIADPAFTDQKQLIAEAKFARALLYFQLVRYWGDVPLITSPTRTADNLLVSRTPADQVYARIQTDLSEATPDLPQVAVGRATQASAQTLSARVALQRQDYATAATLSGAIIQRKLFSLVTDYRLLFATRNTAESIWELQYNSTSTNGLAFWFFSTALGGRNEVGPRGVGSSLEAAYEPGDRRKEASISPGGILLDGKVIPTGIGIKYFRISTQDDDVLVIRYAEVLLIRAEALAQLGELAESLALVNQIRQRAGLGTLTIQNQNELLRTIEQERRVELAMEGHRWFDLIRTGRAQQVLGILDPNKLRLPIPQQDLRLNPNLTQNESY